MKIHISLDLPSSGLSPNARTHWRKLAELKKNYKEHACDQAMAAAFDQDIKCSFELPVVFVHYVNARNVMPDGDNILASLKSAFDGFTDAGIWEDDRIVFYFPVARSCDKDEPRVEITIHEDLPPNYDELLRKVMDSRTTP